MLKIIAATDFSPASKHAIEFIINATKNLQREIVILNVVHMDGPPPASMISSIIESLKAKAYFDYQSLSEEIMQKYGEHLPIRFHAEVGGPAHKVIEKVARDENADMIVLGMKGMSDMQKVFLGSVAASTAMSSKFPVMIVPTGCQIYPIEHIVDATDLYQDESEFNKVMKYAKLFNAKVSMLHIYNGDDETEQARMKVLNEGIDKKYGNLNVQYVSHKNEHVTDGIERFTAEHPTDLLVAFTHKRLFYERLFNPSIAKELAFESKVTLLILKSE